MPIELDIVAFATDGRGIAKPADARIVFVENSLPGEKVVVSQVFPRSSFGEAKTQRVVSPSPHRVAPPCPWFSECGGCDLQHLRWECQSEQKREWLLETLRRIGRWSADEIAHATAVCSVHAGSPFAYRQRIRLHLEGHLLGYKKKRSAGIVPVVDLRKPDKKQKIDGPLLDFDEIGDPEICLIAGSSLRRNLRALGKVLSLAAKNLPKGFSPLELELTQDEAQPGKIIVEVLTPRTQNRPPVAEIRRIKDALGTLPFVSSADAFGVTHPLLPHFRVHRKSFVQPHLEAVGAYTKALAASLTAFAEKHSSSQLLCWDLYAGSGPFSIVAEAVARPLGKQVKCVAVEGVGPAVAQQKANTQGFAVESLQDDVLAFLQLQAQKNHEKKSPLVVVLDPPRSGVGKQGMTDLAHVLVQHEAGMVFFLACDPASFARDSRVLLDAGLRLENLIVFDMFPQTVHYEVAGVFLR